MKKSNRNNPEILDVEGIKVTYIEYKGMGEHRYELSLKIGDKWKQHTLVCLPNQFNYKLKEVVNIYKRLEGLD